MKYFNVPGVYDHFSLNMFFLDLMEEHPEYFYPDVKISSIFGNFHYCIWDGGRNFMRYTQATEEVMLNIKQAYEHYEIPVRFVFTNPLIEEKHLHSRFENLQLEIFHTGQNEVVVNSSLLEQYIRENYPKYKIISSTTKRLNKAEDFLNELSKDYYQVCLDYDLNKDMELLNSIPKELRGKCEFLINAICHPHCPIRKKHYALTGRAQLTYLREKYTVPECTIQDSPVHPNTMNKGNNLSNEEIDAYNKMGYKYFKIEGRTLPSDIILMQYLYYWVKPEWWGIIIHEAITEEGIIINSPNTFQMYQKIYTPLYDVGK